MIAGEFPVMTVPSASVTVPPLTMKSPAEALPSTVTLPPLTVQSTGATPAATTTVPLVTVAPCTVGGAAGGGEVDLHAAGGANRRGRGRARPVEVERDRHRAAGSGRVDRLQGGA